jgi:hypothetical protein
MLGPYLEAGSAGFAENDATGEFQRRNVTCVRRYGLDDFGFPLARELRAGLEGM